MLVVSEGMRYLTRLMTYSMHTFYHYIGTSAYT